MFISYLYDERIKVGKTVPASLLDLTIHTFEVKNEIAASTTNVDYQLNLICS